MGANSVINAVDALSDQMFYVTPSGVTIQGKTKVYETYRDMAEDKNPPKFAWCLNATEDPTVGEGAAFYINKNGHWVKLYETESMDDIKSSWDTLVGRPNVSAQAVEESVLKAHVHENLDVLSGFSVNNIGDLTFNGNVVESGTAAIEAIGSQLSSLQNTLTAHESTINQNSSAISGLQQNKYVFSVNNALPNNNGNVTINIPVDITDLTDTTNKFAKKQDKIVGLAGQFVKINNAGVAVAETIDMSSFGSVKTVNGVSPDVNGNVAIEVDLTKGTVTSVNNVLPDENGNITIAAGTGDVTTAQLTAVADRVSTTESSISTIQTSLGNKVDKNGTDRLMTAVEGVKLATYPADYSTISTAISAKADASSVYTKEVADSVMDEKISAAITSVHSFKGQVADMTALESVTNPVVGDIYNVVTATNGTSAEYYWNGNAWEEFGTTVDMSGYATKSYADSAVSAEAAIARAAESANTTLINTETTNRESAVSAVDQRVTNEIARATGAETSINGKITTLNSDATTEGSVAYAVKAEETRATGIEAGLRTDVDAANTAITTLNGTGTGSVSKAAADAESNAKSYTDTKIEAVNIALSSKVDVVENSRLMQNDEATKLSTYPSTYSTVTKHIDDKINHLDYTAWAVYPTNEDIPADTIVEELGGYVTNAIPAQMTEKFVLRATKQQSDMDVVIDWGDGSTSSVKNNEGVAKVVDYWEGYLMYDYHMEHTYSTSGKYIIKIYGKDYTGIRHNNYQENNLMCECFTNYLPIASHWFNFAEFARGAKRLLKIQIPWNYKFPTFINLGNMCIDCSNLISATGFSDWNSLPDFGYSTSSTFKRCISLRTTDFVFPIGFSAGGMNGTFSGCVNLERDISEFFGINVWKKRFINKEMNPSDCFLNCAKLTGTVPANVLWEDPSVNWTTSANTFAGCSEEIRAQVPTSWGGTNTEIQANINAGFFKYATKNEINTAAAPVDKGVITQATFTIDYANGDSQLITTTANLAISASNIPVGTGMLVRIDNTAGFAVSYNGEDIITEIGEYYVSFVNMAGKIDMLGGAIKVM